METKELVGRIPSEEDMVKWLNAGWSIHLVKSKEFLGYVLTCLKEE